MNTYHGKFGSSLVFEPVKFTSKIKQTKQEVKAIEKQQKLGNQLYPNRVALHRFIHQWKPTNYGEQYKFNISLRKIFFL